MSDTYNELKVIIKDLLGADEDAQKINTVGEAVKYIEANKK